MAGKNKNLADRDRKRRGTGREAPNRKNQTRKNQARKNQKNQIRKDQERKNQTRKNQTRKNQTRKNQARKSPESRERESRGRRQGAQNPKKRRVPAKQSKNRGGAPKERARGRKTRDNAASGKRVEKRRKNLSVYPAKNKNQNKSRKKKKPQWKRINRKTSVKTLIVFFAVVFVLGGLMLRLMYIEYTQGDKYQKIVLANRYYDSVTIPYRRGDIIDSKGIVLATSVDVYNVVLDCSVLTSEKEFLEPTMRALMESFPEGISETEVREYIKDNPDSKYRVLLKQIPYEQVQAFTSRQNDADSKTAKYIKGIWFEKEYIRNYPFKSLASSVVGFTVAGNEGMTGLENYYNKTLNGSNGREYGYLNSDNAVERTIKEATNGNNIVMTIDSNIQSVVEAKILEFAKAYANEAHPGPGAENIGVIIEDPNTGRILAMADYPSYDLTNPRSLKKYYSSEEIKKMSDEEQLDALNMLWRNYCISDAIEPGSTQKPLTIAAGLDSGVLKGNETFECDGFEKFSDDTTIRCVVRSGHGTETLQKALMDSCNDTLMQVVRRMGKEIFCQYQSIYGMGLRTNIDLPGEARTDSLVRKAEETSVIDLATESFGQNFNCTMIQMVSAFSSLINGGNYYQPYVVSKITDESGNTLEEVKPKLLKQTVSKETSEKLKEYLYAVVSEGTGGTAKVPGYSMGGKTGTGEKMPRENKDYLVSFIGYLPQENPQMVIYTVIDTPNQSREGEKQAHSVFAQNLAREILEEILPYMNIYKDEKVKKDAWKKSETNMYTNVEDYEAKAKLGESIKYD